jgi:excisionase family DNA binding protein
MQTIENPFDMLFKKLNSIENQLKHLSTANGKQKEVDFLTVDQAAEYLNLSKATIYKKCSAGLLPYYKGGKKLHFKKSELTKILETGKTEMV